ncbi:MAG: protein kinase [Kofleriaceae bacterium]|nr:protein kinase [Kofleriaceae bacterium]
MARCSTCHRRLMPGRACSAHGGVAAPAVELGDAMPPPWPTPVGRCIGRGGFATAWEIGADRVFKVAHAQHELARARLAREAEAMEAIGAPWVPRLDAQGVLPDGRPWLLMERIFGTTLADLVAAGPIRVERVLALTTRLLDALGAIHAAGYVHRDLKPDNAVIRDDGTVAILDLGLARQIPQDPNDPTRAGFQVGSLEYMPPEQLLDASNVDARSDLYALGCILYELLAGRPPFVGDANALERAHAALRPPPLGALVTIPPMLEAVVNECLAKLRDRRPTGASAVRARIDAIRETTAPLARAQHSVSMIRDGKQPAVLLWAELPKVDRALLATLSTRKIMLVSQRGRRVLGALIGADHADPAGAAIAAGRELAAAGARVALHLELVEVETSAGATKLAGPAIETPDAWLPAVAWTGVVLTRALAVVAHAPSVESALGPGFVVLGEAGETAELFGRDVLVAELVAEAASAIGPPAGGPGLAVLVGDPAIGKSAIAAALVPKLRALGARVIAGALPPPGSGRPAVSVLAEVLPSGAPSVRAIGDGLRVAAHASPLAIVLDDVHLADPDLLDALEYATLGGEALPLWVIAIAAPRLDQRRPNFGERAERRYRAVLAPLDEDAAVELTAALLRPAEYPPLRALRQIAAIARGNPLHLRALAKEIHDRGAIRTRPNGEHFLDTTALDALPPIALGPWLAARELAQLAPELVALARLCAVLGDEVLRDELAAVVELVEARGGATTTVDVDVGLRELAAAGLLVADGARWVFRQALVQDGIYATTDAEERRAIHQAALDYWSQRSLDEPGVAHRVALHAENVGEQRRAAMAFATLGARAHREHRTIDADQAWQGALRNLETRDRERVRALIGRAQARYRLQRVTQALEDLDEAQAIAVELGDAALEVAALLERATALDWGDDFPASAEAAEAAKARFSAAADVDLGIEVRLAEARSLFRAQNLADGVPALEAVLVEAKACARPEAQAIAALLLALGLVDQGRYVEAERVFDELIAMCTEHDDRLHLGGAYANRSWLWSSQGDVERCASDLRTAIQLARELGQASIERAATYNLAESLLWNGSLDDALKLAQRSRAIQRAHGEGADHFDVMLIGRILAARGEREPLQALLPQLEASELSPSDDAILGVLRCVATDAAIEAWLAALVTADSVLGPENRLELGLLAWRAARLPPDRLELLRGLAADRPTWARRLAEWDHTARQGRP